MLSLDQLTTGDVTTVVTSASNLFSPNLVSDGQTFCKCFLRFKQLEQMHIEKHQRILQSVLQGSSTSGDDQPVVTAVAPGGAAAPPGPTFKTFGSLEALEREEEIACRCASEFPGVELLKAKSGKVYLLSDKKKILPKLTLIGGFGTGK